MSSKLSMLLLCALLVMVTLRIEAGPCNPSGKFRAKRPPPKYCNEDDECCVPGDVYTVYHCSPHVTNTTKAILSLSSFEKYGGNPTPSECDHHYHSDDTLIVALSTGWFNKKARCNRMINIVANGKSVNAKVVDVCDSTRGCDASHDYLPPCPNNIVIASMAVWKALEVDINSGYLDVVWSDA